MQQAEKHRNLTSSVQLKLVLPANNTGSPIIIERNRAHAAYYASIELKGLIT